MKVRHILYNLTTLEDYIVYVALLSVLWIVRLFAVPKLLLILGNQRYSSKDVPEWQCFYYWDFWRNERLTEWNKFELMYRLKFLYLVELSLLQNAQSITLTLGHIHARISLIFQIELKFHEKQHSILFYDVIIKIVCLTWMRN